jgi:hypothetical protein
MAFQISLGLERHFNEFEIGEAAAAGVHTVRDHEQHRSVRVGKRGGQTGRIVPVHADFEFWTSGPLVLADRSLICEIFK